MDALAAIFDLLPWWLAALVAVAITVAFVVWSGRIPPWLVPLLATLRAGALGRLLRLRPRLPRLTVVPPLDDPERDPSLPGAVAVDANGTPVGNGPPPENESGSGG